MYPFKKAICFAAPFLLLTLLSACAPSDSSVSDESASSDAPIPTKQESEATMPPTPPSEEELARSLAEHMSTEEKVGQLFFVRCPEEAALEDIETYHLGGILLFGRDFKDLTRQQVVDTIQSYQDTSKYPLLIGVDEEGGTVVRASSNPKLRAERFLSPQALYAKGGLNALCEDAREKSTFLMELGINVNFAPVADVSTHKSDYIYPRTLGQGAKETAEYVAAVVKTMSTTSADRYQAMGSVLKHFPGYGNNTDTHTGVAIDGRSLTQFKEHDLIPFAAGIAAGADSVLVSHNIVECMDSGRPASLSAAVHRVLREGLGFDGVILTDDLAMEALADYTDGGAVAVTALLAGNDMLVTTDYQTQIPKVIEAVEQGTVSEQALTDSVTRVLLWKIKLGALDRETLISRLS